MKSVKKYFSFLILPVFILLFIVQGAPVVFGQTEAELKQQIDEYTNKIQQLQGQANTLQNQIDQFNAQIKLTQLKIAQTEERISLLGGRIDQLSVSLDSLSTAFSSRAAETYKMARLGDPVLFVLTAPDLSQAVTRYQYLQRIQESDRELLTKLQEAQNVYQDEKASQEDLQKELQTQKDNLDAQKVAKASLLNATQNDEKKYQALLAEAKSQLSALRRFVVSQGGASILQNQTHQIAGWGYYYNQRDALWGNIGLGGSSYSVAEYGCLVTSVSMVLSHYGKDVKPSDIAVNDAAFVPGTGYLYHSFSVKGVNVSLSAVSASQLDSMLSSGPVIAGLFSGPDHFIVILRKEGGDYIMNDPFLENGYERKLSEKYSVSDITSLRSVSF